MFEIGYELNHIQDDLKLILYSDNHIEGGVRDYTIAGRIRYDRMSKGKKTTIWHNYTLLSSMYRTIRHMVDPL